ncbi:hypothetical protein CYMTET_55311 [Cymbomonas tetramitiformis]|uniref:Uncharacterized protein n=1 Tax=Cymbomonas tetramitiformis TaxID=36881 RepID=A0AAE0BEK4_9CHLO|nr:hypothetical protein CYMTET_55311 [Cymbomonas tetramitiformis]
MGGNIEALENDDAGDFKIDLKYADPETGATWLMKACSYGAMKCAKALLEAGAEPNAEDSEGKTLAKTLLPWSTSGREKVK